MINSIKELLQNIGADTIPIAEKAIYKGTSCGASIKFENDGVTINSIVEGSDAEVTSGKLMFPFEEQEFWNAVDNVDSEASELWEELQYESNLEIEEEKVHCGEYVDLQDDDFFFTT